MVKRKKCGRPRLPGKRTPSGQLSRAGKGPTKPNDQVERVRAAFNLFVNGSAVEQLYDSIGRLWAAGLLDGHGADPVALRDKGREYGERYWGYYRDAAVRMGGYEGVGRQPSFAGGCWTDRDHPGEIFTTLDTAITAAGREARNALHQLVVDHFWFPDGNAAWVDRLITGRCLEEWKRRVDAGQTVKKPVKGALPTSIDRIMLALAVSALKRIVTGAKSERRDALPSLAELTRPEDLGEAA